MPHSTSSDARRQRRAIRGRAASFVIRHSATRLRVWRCARAGLIPYPWRTLRPFRRSARFTKCLILLAPRAGFEPATNRLTANFQR
jgi:hypothetical protein